MDAMVSAMNLLPMKAVVDLCGLDWSKIGEEFLVTESLSVAPNAVIPWQAYVVVMERIECAVGIERFVETIRRSWAQVVDYSALAKGHKNSKAFFLSLLPGFDAVWPCISSKTKELEDGRLHVHLEIDPALPGCRSMFLVTVPTLEQIPTWMGLPFAEVEVTCDNHVADYLIRFPDETRRAADAMKVDMTSLMVFSLVREAAVAGKPQSRPQLEELAGALSNAESVEEISRLVGPFVREDLSAEFVGIYSVEATPETAVGGEVIVPLSADDRTIASLHVRPLPGFRDAAFKSFTTLVGYALQNAAFRVGLLRRRAAVDASETRAYLAEAALKTNLDRLESAAVLIDREGVVRGANEGGKAVLASAGEVLVSRVRDAVTNAPTEALVEIRDARGEDGVRLVVARPRAEELARRIEQAGRAWGLTKRQTEVLECVARGLTNKEIARELECAEITVENHVTQLLRKSGAGNRAGLAGALASREGEG